jgi:hypothetical protein
VQSTFPASNGGCTLVEHEEAVPRGREPGRGVMKKTILDIVGLVA